MTKSNTSAPRVCLRCETPSDSFSIATHVCDRCIAIREHVERRELLGGKHPELDGRVLSIDLRYVKSARAVQIIRAIAPSLDRPSETKRQSLARFRRERLAA